MQRLPSGVTIYALLCGTLQDALAVQVSGELVYSGVLQPAHARAGEVAGTSPGPELLLSLTAQPSDGASSLLARLGVDSHGRQPLLHQAKPGCWSSWHSTTTLVLHAM